MTTLESTFPFTKKAFDLIAKLNAEPKTSVYKAHKGEFQEFVIQPLQQIMRQVAKQLPTSITDRMETRKRVFAQIPKNDYGKGNAWDFYWGAFYPKGQTRPKSAQLFMWMNHERVEAGFFVGVYGQEQRQRFLENCQQNSEAIAQLLEKTLVGTDVLFGVRNQYTEGAYDDFKLNNQNDITKAIKSLDADDVHIAKVFPKHTALQMTQTDFERVMIETYQKVFPFVLLAIDDAPFPLIEEYLASDKNGQPTRSPEYQTPKQTQPDLFDASRHQDLTQDDQDSLIARSSQIHPVIMQRPAALRFVAVSGSPRER